MTRFAVLGAGSAGQGLASYLALKGYSVSLFNPPVHADRFEPIRQAKALKVSGVVGGVARFAKATCDIAEALADADIVLLTLRAFAHRAVIEEARHYLAVGQTVVVVTGYWASLRLRDVLSQLDPRIVVAETTLLPIASEALSANEVRISGVKSSVKLAAFPATRTQEVVNKLAEALPEIVRGETVLDTNLDNFNPVFHTAIALFNLGELERDPKFEFYRKGTTPKIAAVMDSMDEERLALARKLGLALRSATDSLRLYYGAAGATTYEVFQNCGAYAGYALPNAFDYVREDIPYGLVPIVSLCKSLKVPCPTLQSVTAAWSSIDGVDYWKEGITAKRLGLDRLEVPEILDYVRTGRLSRSTRGTATESA